MTNKIALLGDLHFGIKNHDKQTADFQMKFFVDVFIPYLKKNKITTVIQTGDFFDCRRSLRHATIKQAREFVELTKHLTWYVLVGNHDMALRECIHPNSCTEILGIYPNFTIIDKPTTVSIHGLDIDLIPWICQENKTIIKDFINASQSKYAVGHFELSGFYYYKGLASNGENKGFLSNYIQVWSGHFHTRSENGNIKYIGTPYQLTHGDADDVRGFEVFDIDSKKQKFVENTNTMYSKLYYDCNTFDKSSIPSYANMHIKLIVEDRGDAAAFDMLIEEFSKYVYSIKIIDNFDVASTDSSLKIDISDTLKLICDYIDELDESAATKKEIKKLMTALYKESTNED